jgi:hypothetical protein
MSYTEDFLVYIENEKTSSEDLIPYVKKSMSSEELLSFNLDEYKSEDTCIYNIFKDKSEELLNYLKGKDYEENISNYIIFEKDVESESFLPFLYLPDFMVYKVNIEFIQDYICDIEIEIQKEDYEISIEVY